MKYIAIILVGLVVGAGSAFAATMVKSTVPWAQVRGEKNTNIYRVVDVEKNVACYMAYTNDGRGNYFPEMECVKL